MKYKNLILFIAITFLRSVFIATLKFFLRSYLKDASISLEEIAGYLSLWGIIAYLIWSSITYTFRKKNIILFSWFMVILSLIIGNISGYYPFRLFVLLISSIGFGYNLRLVVKSIILSIEIQKTKDWEAKINGIINITILAGILLWSYLWFAIFAKRWSHCFYIIIWLLALSNILTMLIDYDKKLEAKKITTTMKQSFLHIMGITKKYIQLLIPIGVLWAISTAIGQKMLEIGVNVFDRTPKNSISIVIMWFIWAILGHFISVFFTKKRKSIAIFFTMIFWLTTIYFPHIINAFEYYITLNIFAFSTGIFFWIAVNLLEWRYFFHIGEDQRKEYWSVAYGIITSSIIFIIMIISDYLSKIMGIKISFFFFGIILLLMPFFIRKFDKSNI